MNILFITRSQVYPLKGGTERVTHTISKELQKYGGINCFSAFYYEDELKRTSVFDKEIHIKKYNNRKQLCSFIVDNHIKCIICQNEYEIAIKLRKWFGNSIKIIFVHHYQPGSEERLLKNIKFNNIFRISGNTFFGIIRAFISVPYLKLKKSLFPNLYRKVYKSSDFIVLLSQGFRVPFIKYGKIINPDINKFVSIPNPLSFNYFVSQEEIIHKEKKVLIVSRLEECQKRISKALSIWCELMKDKKFNDWTLDIVGDGPDKEYYEKLIDSNKIPNVKFWGSQKPNNFYLKSSIFLMTSQFEGWGLTLTEAQQYGCVPVAFDTYESLQDIIENNINGFIISENNEEEYLERLKLLISDRNLRIRMMLNAVESTHRFNTDRIGHEWLKILSN